MSNRFSALTIKYHATAIGMLKSSNVFDRENVQPLYQLYFTKWGLSGEVWAHKSSLTLLHFLIELPVRIKECVR